MNIGLMKISDAHFRDAQSVEQSTRGRVDSAFEAGYCALLSVMTENEREASEHPNKLTIIVASERIHVDPELGLTLLVTRYSPDEYIATLDEVSTWAEAVRSAARNSRKFS